MKRGDSIWYEHRTGSGWWSEYPENSMYSFFKQTADKYPEETAIEFEGKKTTFKSLVSLIEDTATAFVSFGINKGDTVSIVMPNVPQALVSVYALNRIGAVANVLHPLLSANELKVLIERTKSKAIITLDMIYPKFAKTEWEEINPIYILGRVCDALPFYKKAVYNAKNKVKLTINTRYKTVYWNDAINAGKKSGVTLLPDAGKADDLAVILYSGGTTGIPKGVMITNFNINCLVVQTHDTYPDDDLVGIHSLALMPVFHGFGLGVCMHAMLCKGLHVFMVAKFDMDACIKLIFKRKISFLFGVPALFQALARSELIETKDLSFLKLLVSSGDKTPANLFEKLNEYLIKGGSKARLTEAYGQTECVSGCCINTFWNLRKGSMGMPYTDVEMKVVAPGTNNEVPYGESGEICLCSPTVMKGYFKNEEETKKIIHVDGEGKRWLHTGDIGYRDDDGYYYFGQRYCRMIITSGYNIYPAEIENAIHKYRAVAKCCVVGVTDKIIGQRIRAYVVMNNTDFDENDAKEKIMELCRKNVAQYSLPHEIVFRKDLPTSSLGKIDFKKIMEEANSNQ